MSLTRYLFCAFGILALLSDALAVDEYPVRSFLKAKDANSRRAHTVLSTVSREFTMFEGAYPIAGIPAADDINDLSSVETLRTSGGRKLLYLIPITSYEENQKGVGVRARDMEHAESAFVHASDPGLLTFSGGTSTTVRLSWRRDQRTLPISRYDVYRKLGAEAGYQKIASVVHSGLNMYSFIDTATNTSACYKVVSFSSAQRKEYDFTHPRCRIPAQLSESPVISAFVYHVTERGADSSTDDDLYSFEFWSLERQNFFVTAQARPPSDCGLSPQSCFQMVRKSAEFAAVWNGYFAYRVEFRRRQLAGTLASLRAPLTTATRFYREYQQPVFSIESQEGARLFPTRQELITIHPNGRIRDRFWLGWYMNPNSNTWRSALVTFAQEAAQLGYTGLFLDEVRPYRLSLASPLGVSAEAPAVEFPTPERFWERTDDASDPWGTALKSLISHLKSRLQDLHLRFFGNTLKVIHPDETNAFGPPATLQARIDSVAAKLNGVMFENAFHNGQRAVVGDAWDREVLKIEEHLQRGRDVIAFITPDPELRAGFLGDVTMRLYIAATVHMIGEGSGKFFAGYPELPESPLRGLSGGRNNLFPEFRAPLGQALSRRIYRSFNDGRSFFWRKFEQGFVFVNTRSSTVQLIASEFGEGSWDDFSLLHIADVDAVRFDPGKWSCTSLAGTDRIALARKRGAILVRGPCTVESGAPTSSH